MSRPNSTVPPSTFLKPLPVRPPSVSGRNSPARSGVASFLASRQRQQNPRSRSNRELGNPKDNVRRPSIDSYASDSQEENYEEAAATQEPHSNQQQQDYIGQQASRDQGDDDEYEYGDLEDSIGISSPTSGPPPQSHQRDSHATSPKKNPSTDKNPILAMPPLKQLFDEEDDDNGYDPFADSTVTFSSKSIESMRLPVPGYGQQQQRNSLDSPVPWSKNRKREGSDDLVEIKQETYQAAVAVRTGTERTGTEKVINTEQRLSWNEKQHGRRDQNDDLYEDGYGEESYESDEYENEDQQAANPTTKQEYGRYTSLAPFMPLVDNRNKLTEGDGIWSATSPTVSSKEWLESHQEEEKVEEQTIVGQRDKGKGKLKEVQINDHPPRNERLLPIGTGRKHTNRNPVEQWEDRSKVAMQAVAAAAGHVRSRSRGAQGYVEPRQFQGPAENNGFDLDPHNTGNTWGAHNETLIPQPELAKIKSFPSLLVALTNLRSSATIPIPPSSLQSELDALASSSFPSDPSRAESFYNKLDESQYALAGEYVDSKKRELEQKINDCRNKRRRIVEEMVKEVEKVADVRVAKLKRTEERREVLRGGIGRMLREGGLSL